MTSNRASNFRPTIGADDVFMTREMCCLENEQYKGVGLVWEANEEENWDEETEHRKRQKYGDKRCKAKSNEETETTIQGRN